MKYFLITILLTIALLFSSCIKKDNFPPQPKIEFIEFNAIRDDSATCTISFQDGDGDIGALEGENTKNLFLYYYIKNKVTGEFELGDADTTTAKIDTILYDHQVPNLTPVGQNKSLEGEILVKFSNIYFFPKDKVFKYRIFLFDRAGNKSNEVFTKEIIAPL